MKNFAFHRPQSVSDALTLLRADDSAKLLSGGQSLLPVMKLDLAHPSGLVSLAGIRDLKGVRSEGGDRGELVIGAFTTHDEVASSDEVRKRLPALASLAAAIGDAQIRNRGTLGGSLAHADPAADYPAAVVGLGATIVTDRRSIAADDFFTGLFSSELAPDEIITAVRFPVPERAAYAKFPHPASKYAVVGVFVAKTAGGVRVAVTGAGAKAFRVPAMETALNAQLSADAIKGVQVSPADLRSDGTASAEYRAHLVTVMAQRAVRAL